MTPTMRNRLFMIFTGMLYMGAMLAGLAGHGWAVMALFVGVFTFWLVAMTPGLLPSRLSDMLDGGVLLGSAARLGSQIFLVLFCFALGRGVGGVTGIDPALPLAVTLGLSFLALPAARLLRPGELA